MIFPWNIHSTYVYETYFYFITCLTIQHVCKVGHFWCISRPTALYNSCMLQINCTATGKRLTISVDPCLIATIVCCYLYWKPDFLESLPFPMLVFAYSPCASLRVQVCEFSWAIVYKITALLDQKIQFYTICKFKLSNLIINKLSNIIYILLKSVFHLAARRISIILLNN